jgi:hypothetical protein
LLPGAPKVYPSIEDVSFRTVEGDNELAASLTASKRSFKEEN